MSPISLFSILALLLVAILIVDGIFRRKRSCAIATIGATFKMSYSPLDRFALSERLMTSRQWMMRASDLTVKDVLYTTREGARYFVATVKCRWSFDQEASRFIVCVIERADHQNHFQLHSEPSKGPGDDAPLYSKLISNWAEEASKGTA